MTPILQVEDLRIDYNGKAVIDHACLELNKGSITYLFGSNGAGKTSLIKAILGLTPFSKGRVLIDGKPNTQEIVSKYISYLPQNPRIDRQFPITVGELIDLACSSHSNCPMSVNDHLNYFNALEIKDKKLAQLSGGQLQKALIARALVGDKPILILDEPFNHLDHKSESNLVSILKQMHLTQSRTILIITHDQSIVDENSDCLMLMHGHLHAGKAKEVLAEHKLAVI